MTAVAADDRAWSLAFDATEERKYEVLASLAGLPDRFTPCSVEVDGADAEFDYDETTNLLTFDIDVNPAGELIVTDC